MTRGELSRALQELGVPAGRPLMVHASLRRLGPVDGGAEGVVEALLDAVGPEGTLVMPLGGTDEVPFDALVTPAETDIGVLAEVFRRDPRTQVNDHPAGRFGALGALASCLVDPTPADDYLGPGSLLDRFTQADGLVLRLGADTDTVTLTHLAEYLAVLPHKRRVRRRYLRADGREQWVECLDDCEGIIERWPGEGDYFSALLADFLATGAARQGRIGQCAADLFAAKAYVPFATAWLETQLREASATG
jgi:aminoglycoside N3'-acetyltransferase